MATAPGHQLPEGDQAVTWGQLSQLGPTPELLGSLADPSLPVHYQFITSSLPTWSLPVIRDGNLQSPKVFFQPMPSPARPCSHTSFNIFQPEICSEWQKIGKSMQKSWFPLRPVLSAGQNGSENSQNRCRGSISTFIEAVPVYENAHGRQTDLNLTRMVTQNRDWTKTGYRSTTNHIHDKAHKAQ